MTVSRAYRFALDPTPAQQRALRSHAGAARFAWNWGLALCKKRYEAEGRWYGAKPLRGSLRRLRRASRAHSRKKPESANRRKHAARLARIHARVSHVRADALHKATTTLAARYQTVIAVDLNVAGMIRNRMLARAISDQGFGAARRMLGYKTGWHGGQLVLADRFYPSSKTCSGCSAVKAKLALSERVFSCESCGLVLDRDQNAARNLLSLAASGAERLNACGAAVRPGPAGRAALNQEPGTASAGQTGTATGQPEAAEQERVFNYALY